MYTAEIIHSDIWLDIRRQTGRSFLSASERAVMDEFADMIADYIVNRWPVATGESANAWQVSPIPANIGFRIVNPVLYAPYVHRTGERAQGPLIDDLVETLRTLLPSPLSNALQAAVQRAEALSRPRQARQIRIRRPTRPSLRVIQGG